MRTPNAFTEMLLHRQPILDRGWRTALYPPGTSFEDALAQETDTQAEAGNVVDPSTALLLTHYWVPVDGSWRTHGWRDVTTLGTVCLRYRMDGPRIHTP